MVLSSKAVPPPSKGFQSAKVDEFQVFHAVLPYSLFTSRESNALNDIFIAAGPREWYER